MGLRIWNLCRGVNGVVLDLLVVDPVWACLLYLRGSVCDEVREEQMHHGVRFVFVSWVASVDDGQDRLFERFL